MSKVTAEQLREAVDDALSFYSGVEEAMPDVFQMLVYTARLLTDRPLTLAALQAGAEETVERRGPDTCRHGETNMHVSPDGESACAGPIATKQQVVVLVPRSEQRQQIRDMLNPEE